METVAAALEEPAKPRKLLQILGPGLITGASDDDPSGIATYSQVGAQFGYGLAWTLLFSYPLMCAIQEISARIGRVTGAGIAGNLRKYYPAWLLNSIVGLLMVANTINIGADLGAMGAALKLLIGGPQWLYVVLFAVVIGAARDICRLFPLCLDSQMADAFACSPMSRRPSSFNVNWAEVGRSLVLPSLSFDTALHRRHRRGARHHHQPLSVFLAGAGGGRRGAGKTLRPSR